MTQIYLFDQDCGFVAGDTETGMTSYAHPDSLFAGQATRKPGKAAAEMLAATPPLLRRGKWGGAYDRSNWEVLVPHLAPGARAKE